MEFRALGGLGLKVLGYRVCSKGPFGGGTIGNTRSLPYGHFGDKHCDN